MLPPYASVESLRGIQIQPTLRDDTLLYRVHRVGLLSRESQVRILHDPPMITESYESPVELLASRIHSVTHFLPASPLHARANALTLRSGRIGTGKYCKKPPSSCGGFVFETYSSRLQTGSSGWPHTQRRDRFTRYTPTGNPAEARRLHSSLPYPHAWWRPPHAKRRRAIT